MSRRFSVIFKKNVKMIISDIIDFEPKQMEEIKSVAADYEIDFLRKGKKYGVRLSYITEAQKSDVLAEKHNLVGNKDPWELKKKNVIQIGSHSLERILKRVGSTQDNVIISLIDRIVHTDTVTQAQFKGYPTLSYTLIQKEDQEGYTFAISFLVSKRGKRFIKMITVHVKSDEPEESEFRIGELKPDYMKKLANMKEIINEQLKNR